MAVSELDRRPVDKKMGKEPGEDMGEVFEKDIDQAVEEAERYGDEGESSPDDGSSSPANEF